MFIDIDYLTDFWKRILNIPITTKYTLDNKSQTIKEAIDDIADTVNSNVTTISSLQISVNNINSEITDLQTAVDDINNDIDTINTNVSTNALNIYDLQNELAAANELINSLRKSLSIKELSITVANRSITKSGEYVVKRTIRPVNGTTDIEYLIVDADNNILDTSGMVTIHVDESSQDDNGILVVEHGYKGIIRVRAHDKISDMYSDPVAIDIDTTLPEPIWSFESNAFSNLGNTTIGSGYNIGSNTGLSTWLVCATIENISGAVNNYGFTSGNGTYNTSTGFSMLRRNSNPNPLYVRVFGTQVSTNTASYTIYVKRENNIISYSTDGSTWTNVANPQYANSAADGELRYVGNASLGGSGRIELYDDLSNIQGVITRFNS